MHVGIITIIIFVHGKGQIANTARLGGLKACSSMCSHSSTQALGHPSQGGMGTLDLHIFLLYNGRFLWILKIESRIVSLKRIIIYDKY
jgi:hypothetical protein